MSFFRQAVNSRIIDVAPTTGIDQTIDILDEVSGTEPTDMILIDGHIEVKIIGVGRFKVCVPEVDTGTVTVDVHERNNVGVVRPGQGFGAGESCL